MKGGAETRKLCIRDSLGGDGDELVHVLRGQSHGHTLLALADGQLSAVEAVILLGDLVQVDIQAAHLFMVSVLIFKLQIVHGHNIPVLDAQHLGNSAPHLNEYNSFALMGIR